MINANDYRSKIETIMEEKPHLRRHLFARGFMMTDEEQNEADYPFYGAWKHALVNGYHFYVHPELKLHYCNGKNRACFMAGHAYNPFTMEIDEGGILQKMADAEDKDAALEILNQLTGVFTCGWFEDGKLTLVSDCASMQIAYYGYIDGHLYVSTHMQMIGDLCGLDVSEYVERLVSYRFYRYYGAFLPADISAYDGVKRLVPNTSVTFDNGEFEITRFYPKKNIAERKTEEEYKEGIAYISDIMRRNVELIAKKWECPAISMTGGMDSKGTVAAANGIYDKFLLFSYVSMPGEQIDADAAHKIAEAVGSEHRIDYISDDNAEYEDIDELTTILMHNFGNIGKLNANDVRKRAYYLDSEKRAFDVEVKSWVSEIGRANYYKKFGVKKMPEKLTPRQLTSMYKLFVNNRRLVSDTDKLFEEYKRATAFDEIFNFDASDMFLWEMRYGGWGGQVITCEHKISFDITIPYNNRLLVEALLSLPLEKRISDQVHFDIIKFMNPQIDETGITVVNYNETKSRMYKEKLYFFVNSHLPF